MNKIELLAPAKDISKAKIAIMYGADAVYVGGKFYSLRSRASNFDLDDLKELSDFAKDYNCKVFVTVNIVFHDDDYHGIRDYLKYLESIGIDGVIVSSLALIPIVKNDNQERRLNSQVIYPIISQGDVIGSVILLSKEQNKKMDETELKLAQSAAGFLSSQMEI